MKHPRSYLFVPGQRPDRFAKAAASGADAVILDLEDAVGPDAKDDARGHVRDWFAQGGGGLVRINGSDTPWHEDDLAALADMPEATVMVPKAEPEALGRIATRLPGRPLVALVETVAGLAAVRETARLGAVVRIAFGNLDFGADARIPESGSVLDPARFEIVMASRLGDLAPPVDGVTTNLKDITAIDADVARVRGMGFGAKLCIHPAQVAAVNDGFSPTPAEIDWAQRILAALQAAAGSVVQVDGKMVDRPLIDRARQILLDAGAQAH
ncbi:citrate lyase subunit beta/citryl-CoA lyase [Rhodobium orientis]|uniref:CoA ester lyase n=1 Tax=Rhodobium orientis TaxID=34017 RepID=A0A327JIN2_9HYPH|nr:CoA ester lyase [Rhodobium orientis]MBB4303236.1 citrate lyase subunit beta/citryl-CoA lyase [Rhodobium orientis]MBK5951664.1 CoA ester lyase [Rhodobium orientis]RAI25861.1 CoA ester lyase [Rhodobium orientis]